jgi:hypothetical protein
MQFALAQNPSSGIIANQLQYAKDQFGSRTRSAVTACLTALLLLQMAMAAWEPLHKFFHKDADEPGHECSVTMLAHGQVDASVVGIPLILPVTVIENTPPPLLSVCLAACPALPPGRGPPLLRLAA